MSIDQLRRECNAVVQASNQRWKSIPQKMKEYKIPAPPVIKGYPVSVYDERGELVAEFQSMKQAARFSETNEHLVRKSVMRNIFIKTKYGALRFER